MRPILPILLACLAGCTGKADDPTMTLLRAGDAKLCVASDIEDTLRRLILPEGNAQAAKDYSISFDKASLESFDKAVGKAQCNAYVKVDGPGGTLIEPTPLDYAISPSAQNPDTFLVSGPTAALRQQLVNDLETRANIAASVADEKAATAALDALVKPGWLIGRWVEADAGSDACISGPYLDFGRKGAFANSDGGGRWSLTDKVVAITGSARTLRLTITEADTDGFTATGPDGETGQSRRCTRQEMAAAAQAQQAEPTSVDDMEAVANALPDLTQQQ